MKKVVCTILTMLAIALVLGVVSGTAGAQDNSTFAVTYYSNANTAGAPDAAVRVIHDGNTGGTVCAAFYGFAESQEMPECSSWRVSSRGLNRGCVKRHLTANALTSFVSH